MSENKRVRQKGIFVIYIVVAILLIAASIWLINEGIGKYREGINHSFILTMIVVGIVMLFAIGCFSLAIVFIVDAVRKYREITQQQTEE